MVCFYKISYNLQSLSLLSLWVASILHVLLGGAAAFQPRYTFPTPVSPILLLRSSSFNDDQVEIHPAVAGWPEKYASSPTTNGDGPRILHQEFAVDKQVTQKQLDELDVANWPTWATSDKPKWAEGNQNKDKIMPYGELSYMLTGKLEIIPAGGGGEPVLVEAGDFVTFPEGFQSDWKVLEELNWHYYLY